MIKYLYLTTFLFLSLFAEASEEFPNRKSQIEKLNNEYFDILVIGGGSTGAGVALDAATRGYKTLLVEKQDFTSQTSSKSTKLLHGGIRYLEKAFLQIDKKQYHLVKEALRERGILFNMAPFLTAPICIIIPIYSMWKIPYMWLGLKFYDYISDRSRIGPSQFLSAKEVLKKSSFIKSKGLKGGIAYYDGQFNDVRLNIALIQTAIFYKATALNYMEVVELLKEENKLVGAVLYDSLSQKKHLVKCKVIINATGPFADKIRKMDNPKAPSLIRPSSGTHILLNRKFTSDNEGILIPKTKKGRVLFILPWQGYTLIGTTDHEAKLSDNPTATEDEINSILLSYSKYLKTPLGKKDIKAIWTGLRPLVLEPKVKDTSKLCRHHVIEVSSSGLVSIMGGKWTTFRKMAQDTVDQAILSANLPKKPCQTENLQLLGAKGYSSKALPKLIEESFLDEDICKHLLKSYGMLAFEIVKTQSCKRLLPQYPYIEGEVSWAVEHEYAQTILDVLKRRMTIGYIDTEAALEITPKVAEIMMHLSSWKEGEKNEKIAQAESEMRQTLFSSSL